MTLIFFSQVVLKKIALDQLLFAPVFLAGFFTIIDLLERKGLEEIKKHLKAEYRNALITNYMVNNVFFVQTDQCIVSSFGPPPKLLRSTLCP